MKNRRILLGIVLGASLLLQGCDLNREPNDYINDKDAFETLSDAKKWDNGVYSTLRGKLGGAYILAQEAQADMLNATVAYRGAYASFHGWGDALRSDDEVIKAVYHSYYAALVDVNRVIYQIPKLEISSADKPMAESLLPIYEGDAYFARAFYYFALAQRWGRPYVEASADKDLCVPLITGVDPIARPHRATNKEVYDRILADLDLAESKLANVIRKEGNDEISADAVIALRARVYLYMGKWAEALAESERLIKGGVYPLISPLAPGQMDPQDKENPFVQMWHYDNGKEQIWQPYVERPNETPTVTGLYAADLGSWREYKNLKGNDLQFNRPGYIPTGSVMYGLFPTPEDRRIPAYFEVGMFRLQDLSQMAAMYVVSKFKGNPKHATLDNPMWGGYVPNGIAAPKPFRIAEQYLIAAEAAYEVNKQDLALQYLVQLRASRGLVTVQVSGDALLAAIREERARELCYEGFRLWDLRRWGMEVSARYRQGQVEEHQIGSEYFSDDFSFDSRIAPAGADKFVWGFPKDEVTEVNPNIQQNQGW